MTAASGAIRRIEVRPLSARVELGNVVRFGMVVVIGVWMYLATDGGAFHGAAADRRHLLPFQTLIQDRPSTEQRMFRELQEGLLEAETRRADTRQLACGRRAGCRRHSALRSGSHRESRRVRLARDRQRHLRQLPRPAAAAGCAGVARADSGTRASARRRTRRARTKSITGSSTARCCTSRRGSGPTPASRRASFGRRRLRAGLSSTRSDRLCRSTRLRPSEAADDWHAPAMRNAVSCEQSKVHALVRPRPGRAPASVSRRSSSCSAAAGSARARSRRWSSTSRRVRYGTWRFRRAPGTQRIRFHFRRTPGRTRERTLPITAPPATATTVAARLKWDATSIRKRPTCSSPTRRTCRMARSTGSSRTAFGSPACRRGVTARTTTWTPGSWSISSVTSVN